MPRHHAADDMANIVQTGLFQHACDVVAIGLLDLYYCAQLFVEQARQYVITQLAELQIDAFAAGEQHFCDRRQQTTIGSIVIGQ